VDKTRRAKLESLIQQELVPILSSELKDPRVRPVTITRVELTQDAGSAEVYVVLFGLDHLENKENADKMSGCLEGLNSAAGYVRKKLGSVIKIRQVPGIRFKADSGLTNTMRVNELLKKISDSAEAREKTPPENETE